MSVPGGGVEEALRGVAPRVLAALMRRSGDFDTAEDAVQDALLAAVEHWPREGVPDRPDAWLIRVASRRMTDLLRGEAAGRRREQRAAARTPRDELVAPAADAAPRGDDTLALLLLCCHPALTPASQVALTLMLLTDARRPARTAADGSLVPLAEQDRTRWDRASIDEGTGLVTRALAGTRLGPYQAQAAIAAVHAEAERAEDTDWPQIVVLYELLERLDPGPVVTLNHAVAVAMARGPRAGLALLGPLEGDERMAGHHRLHAVRAHLLEMAGDAAGALEEFRAAARLTTSVPEQRYLRGRADRLTG